ncbi:MAG: hypothetical protein R3D88_00240 [Alphaproteobacteria bacterium]
MSCKLDGKEVQPKTSEKGLTLRLPWKDIFAAEIVTEICPEKNTALEGLYYSGEPIAHSVRRKDFAKSHADRPDVMATFKVTVEADKNHALFSYPMKSSHSGDAKTGVTLQSGKTLLPKGCYLFALVAGDLERVSVNFDNQEQTLKNCTFTSARGRNPMRSRHGIFKKIYMKWDEEVYGHEYQYSIFNIVASE